MAVDPSIFANDPAGQIAFDESITTTERTEKLQALLEEQPELAGPIGGYLEMLSQHDMIDDKEPGA